MILLARFFTATDLAVFPLCFLILFFIIRAKARRQKDERIKMLYFRAFYFKIICVFAFVLLSEFYFKGGDTGLYFQATQDLRAAINDNPDYFWLALKTQKLTMKSPLFDYFFYDNYEYDLTYNYMLNTANFFPPKLALIPTYLFFNSYLCVSMCFAFFALGGCIRLFKTFYHFYPGLYREIAFACLFLPGVTFWGSGLLKDPVCLGSVGYITYGFLNIFVLKRKIPVSSSIIIACSLLLFFIKVYILLVLVLALVIWQFAEFNKLVENKTLRRIFAGMTFVIGGVIGILLLNYLTSTEAGQQYQLDDLMGKAEQQRELYKAVAIHSGTTGSNFTINTKNPVLLVLAGLSATFFRPFIWEVNTPMVLLAVIESSIFLFLTLYFMYKRGFFTFFKESFSEPRILMCFIFAFVFAVAVGISSANFGALSRYKIPCMPFYLILMMLLYRKTNLNLPRWFNKIIDIAVPIRQQIYVRHSRVG
jgi:hypothetical protein